VAFAAILARAVLILDADNPDILAAFPSEPELVPWPFPGAAFIQFSLKAAAWLPPAGPRAVEFTSCGISRMHCSPWRAPSPPCPRRSPRSLRSTPTFVCQRLEAIGLRS
jgi:hypothetical protein